jgi:peptidylprolyl isomerase
MNDGAVVTVHYHGTLDSGEVFDSSRGRRPRTFVIGRGQLIPGFEAALRRMSAGERTTVRIEPADAYGERLQDRIYEAPRDEAPGGLSPGDEVRLAGGAPAVVVEITDRVVRLDANHPLAGKTLTFEIELISVR